MAGPERPSWIERGLLSGPHVHGFAAVFRRSSSAGAGGDRRQAAAVTRGTTTALFSGAVTGPRCASSCDHWTVLLAQAQVSDYRNTAAVCVLGAGVVVAGWWVIGVPLATGASATMPQGDALTVLARLPAESPIV